jgi:Tfp pilus assembly protein PilO
MLFIFYFQENKEYLDVGIFVAVFVVLCILVILIVIKVGYLLFYRTKFCERKKTCKVNENYLSRILCDIFIN